MAADAFCGFWRWKHWFPNKYFVVNAASLTIIGLAMKLLADLSYDKNGDNFDLTIAKFVSSMFLFVMIANFLPSLGLMNDNELLVNMVALGILLIGVDINLWFQTDTLDLKPIPELLCLVIVSVLSVALTVPTSRKNLEHQYKKLHILASYSQDINFSFKELAHNVKRYWMMAETGNPQFALACSEVASAFGFVTSIVIMYEVYILIDYVAHVDVHQDYGWSLKVIIIVQLVGVVVGSISPVLRCFTSIGYFHISKKWSKNHLNVFKVEKNWILTLRLWKRSQVSSHIPGRYTKMMVHFFKNITLNICIALQLVIVVMCKIICLIPRCLLILFPVCWYIFKSSLKRFRFEPSASETKMKTELKEYKMYVLQIEDGAKLTKRILRNTLNSITRLLQVSEERSPTNLMKLLQDSKGFIGVVEFDDERVPPLISDEFKNTWSLVVVTLTAVAVALPNVTNDRVKGLLLSISEGIYFVRHVEENLNRCEDLVNSSKASRHVGTEVQVYRTWLEIDLRKKARKGKTSKEILQWLSDESLKIVNQFKDKKNASLYHSPHNFVAATSMYRISQTLLLHYNAQPNWPTDMDIFERLTSLIADILLACFTNLPRVITMKCHHDAIEKRQDSIRTAAQILGKSKKILNILEARQLPNIDTDSMAYIDKWRALSKKQILGENDVASSKETLIVSVV
ncbi:uncharacterized protein [Rutidosis leptorrhynchoides]|uniref:uncharacterized protein n=1 Tax=Rutidosis leptorrhynchoides TaxID=125765 RepID=UPI003A9A630E